MAQPKETDYEKLGRALQNIYETGYANRRRLYKLNFLAGLVRGAGSVIGATLVLAALVWALSLLSDVKLLERVVDPIYQTVKKSQQQ